MRGARGALRVRGGRQAGVSWLLCWQRGQRGFSLVELLLCVLLLGILLPALMSGFSMAFAAVQEARMLELSKALAQLKTEELLNTPMPGQISPSVPASTLYPGLFPAGSSNYHLGVTVTNEVGGLTILVVTVSFTYMGRLREYRMVSHRVGL